MSKWIVLSSLVLALPAFAADRWVTCGDHWLEVSVDWTEGSRHGNAYFSGDSRPERGSLSVDLQVNAGTLRVSFPDAAGGDLTVEGLETGNLSAVLRETKESSPVSIGPCSGD